jgi:hypothetical protein
MSKPINLDALFKQARQKEPYYGGKDFVSRVAVDIGRQKKLSKTKEAIIIGSAAVIGATITYAYFPLEMIMQQVPTSFVINPMTVLMAAGITSISCGFAYWLAENKSL